ncbi:hypothetical protein RHGRI_015573 [Rhododendron griersonianum]|uniref:Protein FAR1-RELATED SEQUENCE n=1 Tax=Rhododendron griersonianum TaxID=479676 RepID=A0AAV6KED0_9ERIC|nr:hypothetical protein RHGRI_015573 [Rhododendron griersonianum]
METATMDDDCPEQPCNSTPAAPPLPSPKDTASSPPSPPTIVDGAPPTLPTTVDGAPPTLPTAIDGAPPTSPNQMEGGTGLEETMKELSKDYSLSLGMEFESEEDAYEFYNDHARITGFGIRRCYCTNSKKDGIMINRKFVCSKEGEREKDNRSLVVEQPQRETRTKCKAFMYITFNRQKSKWFVKTFEENHNHILHDPKTSFLLRSQRRIREAQALNIELAVDSGLSVKASHDLISAQSGGRENVGFTLNNHKSYLRARRQRSLQYGEAGALLGYFQTRAAENPYFFYDVQLDIEEKITNIFWADHEMIIDYGLFGDAVSFDTTFQTNKECRPLAIFTGFNHFRMTAIFGAALLYDETSESFEWLFKSFLRAMGGKKPVSIFTDQDAAMAKAISIVMPDVTHGLCTFHLNQNALKHLGHLFKDDSDFGKELNTCIFGYEDEQELEEGWETLIKKYNLQDNMWMKKTWDIRKKWAHVYMNWSFTTGMRSTQLSESLNAKIKKFVKFDHDIVQFFTHFDRLVMEKRDNEIDSIFDSREKLPKQKLKKSPMLIQVAQFYTPPLFDLFHDEVDLSLSCLDRMSVMEIPESYILHRWRLDAKACASKDSKVSVEEDDPKLAKAARYRNLCPKMVKLCARSCELKAAYEFVATGVEDMCAKVDKMLLEVGDSMDEGNEQLEVIDPRFRGVNGLKKKAGVNKRKGKRLKPWYEKNGKRKKVTATPTGLYQDVPMPYVPEMINCESNLSSQTSFHPQTFEVTGDEAFLQDDYFFELISAPQQSRRN